MNRYIWVNFASSDFGNFIWVDSDWNDPEGQRLWRALSKLSMWGHRSKQRGNSQSWEIDKSITEDSVISALKDFALKKCTVWEEMES